MAKKKAKKKAKPKVKVAALPVQEPRKKCSAWWLAILGLLVLVMPWVGLAASTMAGVETALGVIIFIFGVAGILKR